MAGVGVYVASGYSGSSPRGVIHPGFGRRDLDVGVMRGTVDVCDPTGFTRVMRVRSTLQG